jgi:hypothetical protein
MLPPPLNSRLPMNHKPSTANIYYLTMMETANEDDDNDNEDNEGNHHWQVDEKLGCSDDLTPRKTPGT